MSLKNDILKALDEGKLICFPTETVYGLGAPIDSEDLIKKIFELKQRPFEDPLIAHVADVSMAKSLCKSWDSEIELLLEQFWPGPLTIIAQKTSKISRLVTSGLETIAIRCPDHPIAQAIIKSLGRAVVAPSANLFKQLSPTSLDHVKKYFSSEDVFFVDGGPSQRGVESTIIKINQDDQTYEILRPGPIRSKDIQKYLPSFQRAKSTHSPIAPGMLDEHYRPPCPLILASKKNFEEDGDTILENIALKLKIDLQNMHVFTLPESATQAEKTLYKNLHELSERSSGILCLIPSSIDKTETSWEAVFNRLNKALSLDLS